GNRHTCLGNHCFFEKCDDHSGLRSFPTRRSSDLYAPGHGGLRLIFSTDGGHTWIAPAAAYGFLVDKCYGYGKAFELPDGSLLVADRKSTRLNSSHVAISYAVFCLKKKVTSLQAMT